MSPLRFESPLWLVGLLAAFYALMIWRNYAEVASTRSARWVPYARAAALTCLVLVMAGATWVQRVPGIDFHILIDQSASVEGDNYVEIERLIESLAAEMGPLDRAALYRFGREAAIERALGPGLESPPFRSVIDRNATDIEGALRTAFLRLDPAANSRVILVSDGVETTGDAGAVVDDALALGVPIDVYPLPRPDRGEVAVERLLVPASVAPDEPFAVRAVVTSSTSTRVTLILYQDGNALVERQITVDPGRTVVTVAELRESVDSTRSGVSHFEARIFPEVDTFAENNVGYGIVERVASAPVLVVSSDLERAIAIQEALGNQGLSVDVATVATAPLDLPSLNQYRAVIVDNVSTRGISTRQMENLAFFAEENAGGVLIAGGERSFGLGAYDRTPFERILPVAMDAPQSVIMPSLAMLLVLDRSGSMAETQGAFSKLDLAKEAALGVLDVIHEADLLGVLAFDSSLRWIVPIQTVRSRVSFAASIASLAPEGGTNLGPALEEAAAAIAGVDAAVKHVIILTDGRSTPADFETLTKALRTAGASVSTVGIGRDADRALLEAMAVWGDGRFYYTEDIHAIPQIFATETMMVARPIRVDEPFVPSWDQRPDFWFDANQLPPLGGFVITTPKSAAAVHLRAPDGSPILATWRYGLGRTAAFMSSLVGDWSGEWHGWSGYEAFWGQLVRWLMKPDATSGLLPELIVDQGEAVVVVDAIDEIGRYRNFLDLVASVHTPDGNRLELPLQQVGPGRYEARFPALAQGPYTLTVRPSGDIGGDEALPPATASAVVSYPDEFRIQSPDASLLFRLAAASGGAWIDQDLTPLFDHPAPRRHHRSLAPWLLPIAFGLFLLDILLRYAPGRGWSGQVARRVEGLAATWSGDESSPEAELKRRLESRRRAIRAHPIAPNKAVDETPRQIGAGRYLAGRKKGNEDDESDR